jgi:hypothetical protein
MFKIFFLKKKKEEEEERKKERKRNIKETYNMIQLIVCSYDFSEFYVLCCKSFSLCSIRADAHDL